MTWRRVGDEETDESHWRRYIVLGWLDLPFCIWNCDERGGTPEIQDTSGFFSWNEHVAVASCSFGDPLETTICTRKFKSGRNPQIIKYLTLAGTVRLGDPYLRTVRARVPLVSYPAKIRVSAVLTWEVWL